MVPDEQQHLDLMKLLKTHINETISKYKLLQSLGRGVTQLIAGNQYRYCFNWMVMTYN